MEELDFEDVVEKSFFYSSKSMRNYSKVNQYAYINNGIGVKSDTKQRESKTILILYKLKSVFEIPKSIHETAVYIARKLIDVYTKDSASLAVTALYLALKKHGITPTQKEFFEYVRFVSKNDDDFEVKRKKIFRSIREAEIQNFVDIMKRDTLVDNFIRLNNIDPIFANKLKEKYKKVKSLNLISGYPAVAISYYLSKLEQNEYVTIKQIVGMIHGKMTVSSDNPREKGINSYLSKFAILRKKAKFVVTLEKTDKEIKPFIDGCDCELNDSSNEQKIIPIDIIFKCAECGHTWEKKIYLWKHKSYVKNDLITRFDSLTYAISRENTCPNCKAKLKIKSVDLERKR